LTSLPAVDRDSLLAVTIGFGNSRRLHQLLDLRLWRIVPAILTDADVASYIHHKVVAPE
jgi:hypothetical protein